MNSPFNFHDSVYYPCSGHDFGVIRSFVLRGMADTFIHADNGVSPGEIHDCLSQEGLKLLNREDIADITLDFPEDDFPRTLNDISRLPDYDLRSLERLSLGDLFPSDSVSHLLQVGVPMPEGRSEQPPFAMLGRFQIRAGHLFEKTWPHQLQVLFLGSEAISTYDRLFCQEGQRAPKAIALQAGMHIGGNDWQPLRLLAQKTGRLPEYLLLVDPQPQPWEGYKPVEGDLWHRIG